MVKPTTTDIQRRKNSYDNNLSNIVERHGQIDIVQSLKQTHNMRGSQIQRTTMSMANTLS